MKANQNESFDMHYPLNDNPYQSRKLHLSNYLSTIAEVLDITPKQFEDAESRYMSVGKWLDDSNSPLKSYKPEILPQGSFRIGTVIKPFGKEDQFDVDLMCRLNLNRDLVTQQKLKEMIGVRLKSHRDYNRMLDDEKRRCWTLMYSEDTKFHMDILPSIPDPDYALLIPMGVPKKYAESAILITDNHNKVSFENYTSDWPNSNPIGYANWFFDRMGQVFIDEKIKMDAKIQLSVEELRDSNIRTPLQRAIQILKRHRDIMFRDDEDKPISIIITTLAAKAYNQEVNVFDTLMAFFASAQNHIKSIGPQGKIEIINPVDYRENFADKWGENKRKQKNFFKWLNKAREDFTTLNSLTGIEKLSIQLKEMFGEKVVNKALNNYGDNTRKTREMGLLHVAPTGMLSSQGVKVENHKFYGEGE